MSPLVPMNNGTGRAARRAGGILEDVKTKSRYRRCDLQRPRVEPILARSDGPGAEDGAAVLEERAQLVGMLVRSDGGQT